jgi:hypothetical protein
LNLEFDQGLEKIPFEFRSYCWDTTKRAQDDHWNVFKNAAMQIRFGGVSSEAEAKRLYWAEQIGHKEFFPHEITPSEMALNLSDDIQNSFQHTSRPVTTNQDPEQQTVEILNYYFPTEETLASFEMALSGSLDKPHKNMPVYGIASLKNSSTESPLKENNASDFTFEEPGSLPAKEKETGGLWNNVFSKGGVGRSSLDDERPKVKLYVEARRKKQNTPLKNQLSDKIKSIIEDHYLS